MRLFAYAQKSLPPTLPDAFYRSETMTFLLRLTEQETEAARGTVQETKAARETVQETRMARETV